MSRKKCLILVLVVALGVTPMSAYASGSDKSDAREVATVGKKKDVLYNEGKQYFWGLEKVFIDRRYAMFKFTFSRIYEEEWRSFFYLGMCSYECVSAQADAEKAEEYFKKVVPLVLDQVAKGDAECEYFLGYMKEHGFGGQAQNISEAFRLYKIAAEKGDIIAQNSLGLCYHKGKGVSQDYDLAYEWYKKASDAGNIEALCNLGCLYKDKKEMDKAIKCFIKAENCSCTLAYSELGKCYMYGDGVEQDFNKAFDRFETAAIDGNVEAQRYLGICYLKKHDYANAVVWFIKAANRGDALAQCNLGFCYDKGYGVKQDYGEAVKWYRKSAEQGDVDAKRSLEVLQKK